MLQTKFNMRLTKTVNTDQVAKRLREIRIDARLTQKEMGKLINMAAGSVGALENGLYTPSLDTLRTLKKKLNISYDYLLDGEDNVATSMHLQEENKILKEELQRLKKMVDNLLRHQ